MSQRWTHVFADGPTPEVGRREVLCGLGNGYLGVRGVEPEHEADKVNYPGTYVAGGFNRLCDSIDGGDVGYIRITTFNDQTEEAFKQAIAGISSATP